MAEIPTVEFIEEENYVNPNQAASTMKEVPYKIRFLVEAAPNQQSKIATLEKFYDNVKFNESDSTYVVSNQGSEQFILDDKTRFSPGDLIDISKEATEFIGSVAGAAGGTMVNPGGGTILGSGVGMSSAAELFEQVGQQFGTEVLRSNTEHLAQRGTDTIFGSLGQAAAPYIMKGFKLFVTGGKQAMNKAGQRLKNFVDAGVSPSLGQVTQNQGIQTVEMVLANIPGGSGVYAKFAQTAQDDLGKFSTNIAKKLINKPLPANTILVGRTVKDGIKSGVNSASSFTGRFQSRANVLYKEVDSFVKPDAPISMNGTIKELQKLVQPIKGAEQTSAKFSNSFLNEVLEGLQKDVAKNNGNLPYQAVSQLRSRIGNKLSSFELIPDVEKAQLKLVYKALSDDLGIGIAKNGGKKGTRAYKRANSFYKSGLKRIDDYLEPIYKTGDPDKITSLLMNSAKEGYTRVNAIKKSLNPEQYKIFLSSVIERLGRIQPSQGLAEGSDEILEATGRFSSETFLTNWNKLSKETKNILFSGKGFKGLDKDLDKVAKIASVIRESGKTFKNPSGTADRLVGQGLIFGGGATAFTGNPAFILSVPLVIGGANQTAKLMTNPKFVKWMAQGTDIASNEGFEGVAKHISKLGIIMANSDSQSRQAINEYLQMIMMSNANKKKTN
tara:strand:- start:395 stop:2398 length:2004 start_codon:yes stop_codon:yes gene_type:complete